MKLKSKLACDLFLDSFGRHKCSLSTTRVRKWQTDRRTDRFAAAITELHHSRGAKTKCDYEIVSAQLRLPNLQITASTTPRQVAYDTRITITSQNYLHGNRNSDLSLEKKQTLCATAIHT